MERLEACEAEIGMPIDFINDPGERLWLSWPRLGSAEYAAWSSTGECPTPAVALFLCKGDTLICSATTIHGHLALTIVVATGMMH